MPRANPDPAMLAHVLSATRALDRPGCLERAAAGARELFSARHALAFEPAEDGDDLECVSVASDPEATDGEGVKLALGVLDADLTRRLAPDGPAHVSAAATLAPAGDEESLSRVGGALLVPLEASAGPAGALLVLLEHGEEPPRGWRETAERLRDELRPALDNVAEVEMLRQLVVRDDTTDCYNRRCLEENLDEEVERARRFGGRFAIIFLDMDDLKEVNTVHGHAAGSKVLRDASIRIGRTIRSIDRLYRFGGDEFVAILPGTDLAGAREVAERIRRELSREPFEVPTGAAVSLTASTGVAVWPDHAATGRGAVMAADEAMRRVKAAGKDGVESATGDEQGARPGVAPGGRSADGEA